MPIREYKCKDCGNYMEIIQGIHEKPLEECPKCGGKLEKLISNTSFQLKGTGWYKTDYGTSNSSNSKKTTSENTTPASAPSCSCAGGSCGHN